jgi:hypothetical protein
VLVFGRFFLEPEAELPAGVVESAASGCGGWVCHDV